MTEEVETEAFKARDKSSQALLFRSRRTFLSVKCAYSVETIFSSHVDFARKYYYHICSCVFIADVAKQNSIVSSIIGMTASVVVGNVLLVGINAAGIMLSDDAWGRSQHGVGEAILASVLRSHRLVVVFLILCWGFFFCV